MGFNCNHLMKYSNLYYTASCQPDCLNGGRCNNGTCECAPGYSGPGCSIGTFILSIKRDLRERASRRSYRPLQLLCFLCQILVRLMLLQITIFIQISSYLGAHVCIIYEKTKGQIPLRPSLGKHKIQAKEVYCRKFIRTMLFLRGRALVCTVF